MKEEDRNQTKINILLKEYSESQNSAQFHDNLLWVVTSIILAGVLAMIGLMANNFLTLDGLVRSLIAIFGIILSICLWIFAHEFRKIKKVKYGRCKDIEKQIRTILKEDEVMLQHSLTEEGKQQYVYYFVIIALIIFWLIILFS